MDFETFFNQQLAAWPLAAQNYAQLAQAQHKQLMVAGCPYEVVFNPARQRSAAAQVEGGKVNRPCFLCNEALPPEQQRITVKAIPSGHEYHIMVNPYPITTHHFTIVSAQHERQDFKGRHWDMAFFADLMPQYLIFFNGACSGASAPDHMHFQAVPKALVPITHYTWQQQLELGVSSTMPQCRQEGESDSRNIVCWTDGADCHWLSIERTQHRPSQYFAQGPEQFLISPASLEYCGLVPIAREADYNRLTSALLADMLGQCRRLEPMLHVGIMEGQQICFTADERTHALNYVDDGQMLHVMDYGSNRAEKHQITDYYTTSQPFTLEGVTIGKQFHWQQQEDQSFMGALRIVAAQGQLHAINIVPVEEYLKSVISSEMSAMNNLQLLKTHAIISRSWVLRQIQAKAAPHEAAPVAQQASQFIKIWDGNDHTLFDVCADDHCQRYQGITRQASPLVAQAVAETRGMVLTDAEGRICDARFSKCCGGKSELFSSCWQDTDFHYLQPVQCPWCDTTDERVLRLVLNDYDQATTHFHNWEVTYTQAELTQLVNRRLAAEVPNFQPFQLITQLEPVRRGPSGRIIVLRIVGTNQTLQIGKELLIRKALSETHLYSSAFQVETDSQHTTFTLRGIGWGHGVGLCQIGAANMSQQGMNYQQILTHYFTGAQITKLY